MRHAILLLLVITVAAAPAPGQNRQTADTARPAPPAAPGAEVPPVVTHHEIRAGGRVLRYTVTTGLMPLRNDQGTTEANIFYMAYTLDGGGAGVIDVETFSADAALVRFTGHNIHPAIAKGRMVNAVRAAADFVASLPRDACSAARLFSAERLCGSRSSTSR